MTEEVTMTAAEAVVKFLECKGRDNAETLANMRAWFANMQGAKVTYERNEDEE